MISLDTDKDLFQLSIDINLILRDLALLSPECVEFAELKTEIKKTTLGLDLASCTCVSVYCNC